MAVVTFNGATKTISVNTGVTSLNVKVDLYSDWKEWLLLSDNAKYEQAFSTVGGDDLGGGLFLGDYYFLENGWKIKPQEGNHVLTVIGNLISRDGGSPFISTVGNFNVSIRSQYSSLTQTANGGGDPWETELESGWTAKELMRTFASVMAGKVSGAGTATETFRGINDDKNRVIADVDSNGNRTSIILDPS